MICYARYMRKFLVLIILVGIVGGGLWYLTQNKTRRHDMPVVTATIGSTPFRLYSPQTDQDRQTGLAAFNNIASDEGMIFRGLDPGVQSFWMKDMKFDIDILWIDSANKIIHIVYAVPRDSYPKTYQNPPSTESSYVIELNAGTCDKYGIAPGMLVSIK